MQLKSKNRWRDREKSKRTITTALQARRTGTSSPLGELFDHGCDAWATVFICGTFYSVFGRNYDGYSISELRMYTILWSIFLSFHMSHWEKYLTGVMYLPWSYDISMLGGTILYLITSVAGYEVREGIVNR